MTLYRVTETEVDYDEYSVGEPTEIAILDGKYECDQIKLEKIKRFQYGGATRNGRQTRIFVRELTHPFTSDRFEELIKDV